ncbi:hypothetical protein M433DRAFT_353308 [Acidomyces richmondensis BFW]|nr:MAG: hypothetical protein FE78DRAFT_524702 [Acidomyces sp. 'richmondensis']KYG49126.1 hypothetical protein M433DRAFT_353308 [Acidomyces richmondensis BFW]
MGKKIIVWGREFSADPGDWKYEDQYTGRKVPMEVLCLGMSRTGTSSLNEALRILGYNDTHHMACCIANAPECDIWLRAIEAKWFGKGKEFERKDWDKLLGYCMATTDLPCTGFAEELIKAYPEAKVILNLRPVDSWYRSFNETVMSLLDSPVLAFFAWTGDPFWSRFMGMVRPLCEGVFGKFPGGRFKGIGEQKIKQLYLDHYDRIRVLVPRERLYEKDIAEGWEGICKFLGKDVPKVPYPRV